MFLVFKPFFKHLLFSQIVGNLKNFSKFTFFFKVASYKLKLQDNSQKIFLGLKRIFKRGIYSAPITGIKFFIFQRRSSKEGFTP